MIENHKSAILIVIVIDSGVGELEMVMITAMNCMITTSNIAGASGSGRAFLGIAGREFRLLSKRKTGDLAQGKTRHYLLGALLPASSLQVTVSDPEWNDPRLGWALDTANLGRTPKYIRYEPGSGDENWNLKFAAVFVYRGNENFVALCHTAPDFQNLWLGKRSGMVVHLTEEISAEAQATALMRGVAS